MTKHRRTMRAGRRRARRPHGSDFRRRRRRKKLEVFSSFKRPEVEQPAASEAAIGGKRRPITTNCPRANRHTKREAREGLRGGKPVMAALPRDKRPRSVSRPLLAPQLRFLSSCARSTGLHLSALQPTTPSALGSPACICLPCSPPLKARDRSGKGVGNTDGYR